MKNKKQRHRAVPRRETGTEVPADESVRQEWLRRIEAEYRSGAHAQHLTLWLMQLGAPPDLIELGLDVVRDELKHADLSAGVYGAAGGTELPDLPRESLGLARTPGVALEQDVLRVGVEMFCLGETVAVRLFQRLRDASKVGVARDALDQILRDEVSHREFGWTLLAWLLRTPLGPSFLQLLAAELPGMLQRIRDNYGGLLLARVGPEGLARRAAQFSADARAWGVMPVSEYIAAVDEAFARDYAPRFAELGVAFPSIDRRPAVPSE
ncbi:MAG TPA: ferritin-like domain-containing protein [Polyangiales bacterium]